MSMLDAKDNEPRSYMEFVDVLRQHGAAPKADMQALWGRIVFSILISNTDDHLRNHGFLLGPSGWRLSPAYDMNPVPGSDGLKLLISESDNSLDLDLALDVAEFFRLNGKAAGLILDQVLTAVRNWRPVASSVGVSTWEMSEMADAFRLAEA